MKFVLPRWRIQPYVGGGFGATFTDINDKTGLGLNGSDSSFTGRAFGGADFYVTKNWVLFAEVSGVLGTSDFRTVEALNYVSIGGGIQYRF